MKYSLPYGVKPELTQEDLDLINKQVFRNRQSIRNKLNYLIFLFQLSSPVIVPLPIVPPSSKIWSENNGSSSGIHRVAPYQSVETINFGDYKIVLTQAESKEFEIIFNNYKNGSVSFKQTILDLRGGGFEDWFFLGFLIYMWSIQTTDSLVVAPTPHMDPFGYLSRKYSNSGPQQNSSTQLTLSSKPNNQSQNQPLNSQIYNFVNKDGTVNLKEAYQEMKRRAKILAPADWDCSFTRFKELSTEDKSITPGSTREAISGLQGEMLGFYKDLTRENYGEGVKGPDFTAKGLGPYKDITHVEAKGPVGSAIKVAMGQKKSIANQGKSIGQKLNYQKDFWSNKENTSSIPTINKDACFPETPENVLGLVDNFDVPVEEKSTMKQVITKWTKNDNNLVFINDDTNV